MSEVEKQIMSRISNNADLEGAQDLIDAHIDEVMGGSFSQHNQHHPEFIDGPGPGPIPIPEVLKVQVADDALSVKKSASFLDFSWRSEWNIWQRCPVLT